MASFTEFAAEYRKKKKKGQTFTEFAEEQTGITVPVVTPSVTPQKTVEKNVKSGFTSDIAPVKTTKSSKSTKKTTTSTNKVNYFEDGYDFGDVSRTILGVASSLKSTHEKAKAAEEKKESTFDEAMTKKYSSMSLSDLEKNYARIEKEEKEHKEKNGGKVTNYLTKMGSYIAEGMSGQSGSETRAKSQANVDKINDYAREKEILNTFRKKKATEEYLGGLDDKQLKLLDNIAEAKDLENAAPFSILAPQGGMDAATYNKITEVERTAGKEAREKLYNQLKKKNPKKSDEEINELIDNMVELRRSQVNAQEREKEQAELQQAATEHPVASFILSRGANLLGGGIAPAELYLQRDNEYGLDTNAAGFSLTNASSAIDEQVQLDHDWKIGEVDAFDLFYEVGAGMVDNVGRLALAGGNPTASGAIMFSQVATQGIIEGKEKGYSDSKALTMGLLQGTFEAISEKMGLDYVLGSGGGALKKLAKSFVAEGAEEVTSSWLNRIADQIANGKHSELSKQYEAYKNEGLTPAQALTKVVLNTLGEDTKSFVVAGLSGFGVGGVAAVSGAVSNAQQVKAAQPSEDKLSEQAKTVFDKVVEDYIAEAKEDGKTISKRKETEIRNNVLRDMLKGYIDTDTIESVLGGEEYESYKAAKDLTDENIANGNEVIENLKKAKDTLQAEYDTLNKMKRGEMTGEQIDRQNELKDKIADIESRIEKTDGIVNNLGNDKRLGDLKTKLGQSVFDLVKDTELAESYREIERSKQKFEADVSKYKNKNAQQTVQKAIDSGLFGNSNKAHELIDFAAKISEDKGYVIEFTKTEDLERLKQEGNKYNLEADAERIEAFVSDKHKTIVVNVETANKAFDSLIGHEVTHTLESAKSYKALQKAVKSYLGEAEYNKLLESKAETYKGIKADIEKEIVADFCGERLLTDYDFVKHLSINDRNVFQKVWDEIKYLCKIATAGSKEARDLERVKRNFEKAYKESSKGSGTQYSLAMVEAVQPTSEKWNRTLTTEEAKARFPKLWDVTADDSEVRNPTQISSTVKSYRKVYDHLKNEGFDGTILDASSGLGFGTKAGIEEYGFDVEDIEPYPDKNYNPKYKDYSSLNKKYDVVISNAVLNVLPQDQRDALVVKMGEMLNDGGRIFINVRGKDVDTLASNKNNTNISPMEWFVDSTGSYQKGFTKPELVAYLKDALGEGFSVKPTSLFGAVSAVVTKDSGVQYSLSPEQEAYFKDSKVRDENGNLKVMYHGTSKGGFTSFDTYYGKYGLMGTGSYFTDNKSVAESYTNKGKGDNKQVYETYLNITNPIDMDAQANPEEWAKAFPDVSTLPESGTNEKFLREVEDYYSYEEMPKWEVIETIRDAIQFNMGYDGITHIGGGRFNKKDDTRHRVYIAFEPEQIKNIDNVAPTKDADIRYSLSETDNKYLDAVNRGDTETAQRMVDKVAKENGYTIKAYHGTPNNEFTVFDKGRVGKGIDQYGAGFYFATNKEAARGYGSRVIDSSLAIKNPLKIDASSEDGANLIDGGFDHLLTEKQAYEVIKRLPNIYDSEESILGDYYDSYWESGTQDWMIRDLASNESYRNIGYLDSDLFRDYPNELHEALRDVVGYDGVEVTFDNGEKFYVAWFDNQMKSSDAVTYDDNGNVIPLSERFNAENNDIRYSLSEDSEGNKLTEKQSEYFKDSKLTDENGNLKVMYHGSQSAGFHEFQQSFSDDGTSFFFVDSNTVAKSYSGTHETYTAQTFRTAEDFNKFFTEIGANEYEVVEENGTFSLLEDGDEVATSNTAKGLYDEFRDWTGLGTGSANYKVYLNLKNPLIVDAKGRSWDRISSEFSQEVYERYNSLTEDEKSTLVDLAGWEDIGLFRNELSDAVKSEVPDKYTMALASAYKKLGESDIDFYRLFDIATDNFSDESIRENAVTYLDTREYSRKAKDNGYDGVIFNNIVDNGGYASGFARFESSTVAIAFESNQIKSVANANPTAADDIRYSLSDSDGTPIDNDRIVRSESDIRYSISKAPEIAKGQSDYVLYHKRYVTDAELKEAHRVTQAMVDVMMKYSSILPEDKIGKVLTKNGSYDRSVENTTICVRTLAYNEFVDKVQEEIGRPLTQMESFLVSQKLYDIATEPQCLYCYVSLDRKAFNDMLLRYMQDRDTVIAKYNNTDKSPGAIKALYEEFLNGRKDTKPMKERFNKWLDYVDNGTQLLSLADIATEARQTELTGILAEQLKDARKYAQSASWSKIQKNYVAYKDEILRLGDRVVKNLNEHYGLRWYSFSDYSPAFIVENMQQITDAAIRGLKGLSYTKDTDFAEVFAPSGMNINISVFVKRDANGNYYIDERQSADIEKAKDLRNRYPNVGIVATVTDDEALRWAGQQEWSDVIIPFHIVRTGADVAEYYKWLNYTGESADTIKDKDLWNAYVDSLNIKSENARKKVSKNIYPNEHNNDKATYLALCESRGLTPRFVRYAGEDWYMKLVNETRLSATESSPLKPSFRLDAAQESFQKFIKKGGYEGGWYKDGVNVDAEARIVADDVLAGKKANEVDYGRQDGYAPESLIAKRKTNRTHGRFSLSDVNETPSKYGRFFAKDVLYQGDDIAPTPKTEQVETVNENDYAPMTEAEAVSMMEADRGYINSFTDADMPPETDAPIYDRAEEGYKVESPLEDRDITEVGNRKVKAYMYENPEVKPFFQEAAEWMLGDLHDTVKGERTFNDELYYESGGELGWMGTKRHTSPEIADLLDNWHYTYDQIENGLKAIIEDNGAENNAVSKRIEFALDEMLRNGHTFFADGTELPPNQEYINLLIGKQITEYNDEAFNYWLSTLSEDDIKAENIAKDDIAPTKAYEAIRPKPVKQPKMVRADKVDEDQPTANILTEEMKVNKKNMAWSKFKTNFVDKAHPFETLALKTGNREVDAKFNSIRYADNIAQTLIGEGAEGVKALNDIQTEVERDGLTKALYDYLYHKHNVDRMTLEDRYDDVPNKAVFGNNVTAEASQEIVDQYEFAEPKLKEYAQEIYNYNKHLRKLLVEGGVISQETADLWEEMYPHYVPIRRVGDEGLNINVALDTNRTGVNAPIKRATGGNRDILPLFDTMAQRTLQTYKAISKNRFGIELKNTLGTTIESTETNLDEVIDSIDTQDGLLQEGKNGRSPTFTVFENGERVTFEITDEMYDALKPTSEGLAYTNKAANFGTNLFKGLVTEYNPTFMLTNPIKDSQDVLINSQHPARTYKNFPKAVKELTVKGKWYTEYMKNGGADNTYFNKQTNTFNEDKSKLSKVIGFPLEKISEANNFIERIPRLAEYIASRESGRSVDVSMLDAARVTTNFAAGGDVTKFLNRNGATFLNASVQGAAQQVRNVREAKANGLKGWVQLATKVALAGLPSILLNNLMWDDDEEYEELSDYVKQNYYVVAKTQNGKFIRIPKGRALAVIQNAFEQVQNALTGDDEVDLQSFLELAVSNLAPNNPLDNNIIAPIKQVVENKTWYGEDLVPTRLQDLPAKEQYDESTDAISKWLGEKINISPYKFNYLLNQYSGGLGDVVLPMLTPEAESGDNSVLGNFTAPLRDKFSTDSVLNNKNPSEFYDVSDKLKVNANSSNATDEDILKNKYINSVSSELSELYKEKREIQNSNLSDDLKFKQVRDVQKQINELSKDALNTYENVKVNGRYATIGDRHYMLNDKGEWQKITDEQLEKQNEAIGILGITPSQYWSNKKEYDMAAFYPEKYAVLQEQGISVEDYKENYEESAFIYTDDYSWAANNPGKYTLSKAVTDDFAQYRQYTSELNEIKADKDENGKPISGSAKEKKKAYIWSLPIDYGQKIILYRSLYDSKDDKAAYNQDIIDYLNSRDDITYDEMNTICEELGFTVNRETGYISW